MKLLVFGRTGQLASALRRLSGPRVSITSLGRAQADLTDPARCAEVIHAASVDAVVNAAAFTDVDRAETQTTTAMTVNAQTPGAMAKACAIRNLPFIHISTDYVFDGTGSRVWMPTDRPVPINSYGQSKLVGEHLVRAAGGPHVILRTSWVFAPRGRNFVNTMLRLSMTQDRLNVVADQIGGPTPADAIARAVLRIAVCIRAAPQLSGIYHISGAPHVSWAAFAREIFARAGRSCQVTEIATDDYPTPARRPLNARLDCASLTNAFGIHPPDWRKGLAAMLTEQGACTE